MIVDEAYLEFEPDFAERTAVSLTRDGANVIVFRTFAKIYGLAGLSIGYAVAPKALAASLKAKGLGAPHELNRLALAAASASLRDTFYVPAVRAKVVAERWAWNTLLDGLGVRAQIPAAISSSSKPAGPMTPLPRPFWPTGSRSRAPLRPSTAGSASPSDCRMRTPAPVRRCARCLAERLDILY